MGGDPGLDPGHDSGVDVALDTGICASPWVSVELQGRAVLLDGEPVEADGTPEGRYLQALHQIAHEVAAPLGRGVGVTVSSARGLVGHLVVRPDGTVDSLEDLVREANATPSAAPRAPSRPGLTAAGPPAARSHRRSLAVVAAAGLVAAGIVLVAPLIDGGGEPAATGIGAPEAIGAEPAGAAVAGADVAAAGVAEVVVAQQVLGATELRRRVDLASTRASSPATGELVLLFPALPRAVDVVARVVDSDGQIVVRRLRVTPGTPARLEIAGLAAGPARWSARAPGALPGAGALSILAPAPVAPPPAQSQPVENPGGGGGGKHGGDTHADPVVPIDPDDQ